MSATGSDPSAFVVEGLLDGRTGGDVPRLQRAVAELGRCGAGEFRCEITGGRFTVLPRSARASTTPFPEAAQQRFLEALQDVVAAAVPGSIESNLRCRLLYADEVAETLFVAGDVRIEPITRRRPRIPADAAAFAPEAGQPKPALRRREALLLAPLLLVAAVLFAWQAGWIDRALAPAPETLRVDTGPFGALVTVLVERFHGNYRVSLRRGPDYPSDAKQLEERRGRVEGLPDRGALALVGDGGLAYVQLLDADGDVLNETTVSLRPLGNIGLAFTWLPGRWAAARVQLAPVPAGFEIR